MIFFSKYEKECPDLFLKLTRANKTNGKDILDCVINIYVHTELADWLY